MHKKDLIQAHTHSSHHRVEILQSETCGCFCCLSIIKPEDIEFWVDEVDGIGQTAICPNCGIDSVIGSASGYVIDSHFLTKMEKYWFKPVKLTERKKKEFGLR
jgi:hypothetical protein